MMKKAVFFLLLTILFKNGFSGNPIIPNQGVNDPHIHIFNGKAYLSASHDKSMSNDNFNMDDWWLWSSENLVDWKPESVLKPEDTYIGRPFSQCWATDIAYRHGKYYWYFSEGGEQTGVVVGNSPSGPWYDPLKKPLLPAGLTPTHEYDPGIFKDVSGDYYVVFGVWEYYIAKLNDDMISLSEAPREIIINHPHGPYNLDGKNKKRPTDDKPFLHFYKGKYYLSWGCFYAMSDNVYGPYQYTGSIIDSVSFAKGCDAPTWPKGFRQGRHGSFFEWHHQCYFAYCDISQTGNRYFRDTFISYVHYKDNGEIAPIRVDGIGVGAYDANNGIIQAEDYFKASGTSIRENQKGGFFVDDIDNGDYLVFPNVKGLTGKKNILFKANAGTPVTIEIRKNSQKGELIASCNLAGKSVSSGFDNFSCSLPHLSDKQSFCFVFKGRGKQLLQLDSFKFE